MAITAQNINQKPGYKQTEVGVIPEDWQIKRLEELGSWRGGATPSMTNASFWINGTIHWASSGDIKTSILSKTASMITGIAVKQSSTTLLQEGAILIVTRSGILRKYLPVAKNTVPIAINQDIKALVPNSQVSADYLLQILSERGPDILSTCMKAGTTVESVEYTWLKKYQIPLPPLPEQQAIATVLSDVDALITSLDRLIAKKRDIKQAAMQQLLTGKTRLPGFASCGSANLGDFFELNPSKTYLNDTDLVTFIRMEDVSESGSLINQNIMPFCSIKKGLTFFERNDVLVAKITPCFENGKGACLDTLETKCGFGSTEFHVLRARKNAVPRYIFYQTQLPEFRNRLEAEMIGTAGQKRVPAHAIIDYPLPVYHSRDEQRAIATILSDMDAEIAALEQQRDKTRALKQGMMQELLTGKTRLV